MTTLKQLIPEAETMVGMHTADLAGYILEALMSPDALSSGVWNRYNFCSQVLRDFGKEAGVACSAAWSWLEVNGLICHQPDQGNDWFVPTQRGRDVRDHQSLRQLISSEQLPEHFLHQEFVVNVRPLFLQSRFETAVFEAFKTLEVAVRESAGFGDDAIGVALASRAFHPDDDPLTDTTLEKGERVALMNLMTGAMGSYKNPSSHRRVAITAEEARDMIILASHLLKIVETRATRLARNQEN